MGTVYLCETDRLVLRCWQPADAPAAFPVISANEAHLAAWLPWVTTRPRSIEEQAELFRRFRSNFDLDKEFVFGAFLKDGECVGSVGLHRSVGPNALEVGYWLRKERCGLGLGTEMVGAACQIGFLSSAMERLEIHCAPENRASARIAEKLGFTHEATLARRLRWANGQHDMMVWARWREDPPPVPAMIPIRCFDVLGQPQH
jgi:RimJ/RimL family protein N-acetyltransferase